MITLKTTNEKKLLPDGIPEKMDNVGVKMFGRRFLTDAQFGKLVEYAEKNAVYKYEKGRETIKLLKEADGALYEVEMPVYSNRYMHADEILKATQGLGRVKEMLANVDACAKEAKIDKHVEEPQLGYHTYAYKRETVINFRIKQLEDMLKEQTENLPNTMATLEFLAKNTA